MILKVATNVDSSGNVSWKDLYANAIRMRLRRDRNLSDVADAKESRDNLGVTKAIADAEQEAIDVAVEYARKNDTLIWARLDEKIGSVTEDMYYLQENIGTWNYISYDNEVVDDLSFVDYIKGALTEFYTKLTDDKAELVSYIDDSVSLLYDGTMDEVNEHYDLLNKLVKQWWELFQGTLRKELSDMLNTLQEKEEEIDIRIDAMEDAYEVVENNLNTMHSDLSAINNRVDTLRDRIKIALDDLMRFIRDSISALANYTEEAIDYRVGVVQQNLDNYKQQMSESFEELDVDKGYVTMDEVKNYLHGDYIQKWIPKVWNNEGKLEFYYKGGEHGQIKLSGNVADKHSVTGGNHDVLWIDS